MGPATIAPTTAPAAPPIALSLGTVRVISSFPVSGAEDSDVVVAMAQANQVGLKMASLNFSNVSPMGKTTGFAPDKVRACGGANGTEDAMPGGFVLSGTDLFLISTELPVFSLAARQVQAM
jgi:hypothetical protein